ncbi:MAG TPA: hypothetical protein VN625_07300, partial [Desulfuromonadaceae bacterium]|nr:hypothetical protein [Desulfuromonadaceae bacterium]
QSAMRRLRRGSLRSRFMILTPATSIAPMAGEVNAGKERDFRPLWRLRTAPVSGAALRKQIAIDFSPRLGLSTRCG